MTAGTVNLQGHQLTVPEAIDLIRRWLAAAEASPPHPGAVVDVTIDVTLVHR